MSSKLLKLGMAALMSLSMVGCSGSGGGGSSSGDKITLTVWTPAEDQSDEQGNWLDKELTAFKEAHPEWNLDIKVGVMSEGDAGTTVPQDPEAAADVYMFANDQITNLIDAGALAELGGSTLDEIKEHNTDTVMSYVTYEDGVYGVPFTTNTWFMYYDKSVFTEDDIKNLDTMLQKGVVAYPLSNAWYLAAPYLANGCTMFGEDGMDNDAGIDFSGDKAVAVTNYLVDLAANPNFKNDADGVGIAGLADGSVNAIFSGSWDYNNVKEALGDNMGIAPVPTITINGEQKQLLSFAGVKAIGVNAYSKNPEQAVALAAFLGSTQAQQDHFDLRMVVPTDTTIDVSDNPLVKAQNDTINDTSFIQPFVSNMSNFWSPAETFGTAIVNGKVTHDNAAEQTEKTNDLYNSSAVE
ncbi:MAG: extracellular solute-binding protein [Faecalicoccus sp.]|nr:extracellular solute-binding protein [Faecalicoccus sp.]